MLVPVLSLLHTATHSTLITILWNRSYFSPFHRWGNWGTEMLSSPPKVVAVHPGSLALKGMLLTITLKLLSGQADFQTWSSWAWKRWKRRSLKAINTTSRQFHLHVRSVWVMHFSLWCIIPSWKMYNVNLVFKHLSCSCYCPENLTHPDKIPELIILEGFALLIKIMVQA